MQVTSLFQVDKQDANAIRVLLYKGTRSCRIAGLGQGRMHGAKAAPNAIRFRHALNTLSEQETLRFPEPSGDSSMNVPKR